MTPARLTTNFLQDRLRVAGTTNRFRSRPQFRVGKLPSSTNSYRRPPISSATGRIPSITWLVCCLLQFIEAARTQAPSHKETHSPRPRAKASQRSANFVAFSNLPQAYITRALYQYNNERKSGQTRRGSHTSIGEPRWDGKYKIWVCASALGNGYGTSEERASVAAEFQLNRATSGISSEERRRKDSRIYETIGERKWVVNLLPTCVFVHTPDEYISYYQKRIRSREDEQRGKHLYTTRTTGKCSDGSWSSDRSSDSRGSKDSKESWDLEYRCIQAALNAFKLELS